MTPTKVRIQLKQGVEVNALLTPALYGVAAARGIDLGTASGEDMTGVTRTYARIAYCAAINAWEVESVDHPDMGDFPYTYEDFDAWAWTDADGMLAFIDKTLAAFTGKGLKETAREAVKKKTMKADG